MRVCVFCSFLLLSLAMKPQGAQQVVIDLSTGYQTIESFSASDCWSVKDVGQYWNEDVKENIAKMLFSSGLKYDGSPEGIALSMWRFNLGSGSIGDADIKETRQTESFLSDAGEGYDWSKQAGQQWFMNKAREYGCDNLVAFANSPLVVYTKNGKGYANVGEPEANLRNDKYGAYADYVADVMKHFQDEGKAFRYFSPVNEPQYDWATSNQEGSPWQNAQIRKIVQELNRAFQAKNVETKVLIAEAGNWTYLYETHPNQYGGRASNQIYEFFDARSNLYIGNLPSLEPVSSAHSYWTTTTNAEMKSVREQAKLAAQRYGLRTFQTEWSLLSGGQGIPEDLTVASYMDNALFLAKVVYSDMKHAQVASWSYWTALGVEQWGHKNRFLLISLTPGGGLYGPITLTGTASATKNLWTLGNYSYFVRPGYKRINMNGADDMAGLMGTAYLAPDSSKLVTVYVNMSTENKKIKPSFANTSLRPLTNKRYVTNSSYDLKKYGSSSSDQYVEGKELQLLARSVTTVVYEMNPTASNVRETTVLTAGVSPHPVRKGEYLNVRLPEAPEEAECSVTLSALSGERVWQGEKKIGNGSFRFPLPPTIPPGLYLLKISCLSANYINKIVIL